MGKWPGIIAHIGKPQTGATLQECFSPHLARSNQPQSHVSTVEAPLSGSTGAQQSAGKRGRGLAKVGWVPEGEIKYPEWIEAGRYLGALGRGHQWWIGDWIRFGTMQWGEKYAEAARLTGYDRGTLRNLAWVASQFSLSRRRDKLTWTHHLEVAPLKPDEQDHWLDRAIEDKLSAADLRSELRTRRRACQQALDQVPDGPESSPNTEPAGLPTAHRDGIVCPNCGHKLPLPRNLVNEPPPVAGPRASRSSGPRLPNTDRFFDRAYIAM
jgi:hypothetical protein